MLHTYSAELNWSGSTADGYRVYSRDHQATATPAAPLLELSADKAFRGDPQRLNPEQLMVIAASSCQLLSFLAVAAREGIDVRGYADSPKARMNDANAPARIDGILLSPTITVAPGTDHGVVHSAHDQCYIANSLSGAISIEPSILDTGEGME